MNPRVLTERQYDVLLGASRGETSDDTARRLNVTRSTIKDHRKAVLDRLGARDMCDATGIAIRRGMLP